VLLGLLILPSVGLVAMMIQLVLGLPLGNPQLEFLLTDEISISGVLIMLVFGGVIVPIAEEIFFRGLLYSWLRQTLKIWPAILISSALFGVLHGEISIAGATFVMGIILAWIYEKSTSLWPAISIHIINNSIKLLVLYLMIALGGDIPTLP
jgi:membrane protease YdiL (CAAX protease family)